MEEKFCPACKNTKSPEEFPKNKHAKSGLHSYCKTCANAMSAEWRAKNPQLFKQVKRNSHLKMTYGLAPGDFDILLEKQNNQCAICGTTEPGHKGVFAVDHCHWTNRVRGLLCVNCNRGIGWLKDDPSLLDRAAEYLRIRN